MQHQHVLLPSRELPSRQLSSRPRKQRCRSWLLRAVIVGLVSTLVAVQAPGVASAAQTTPDAIEDSGFNRAALNALHHHRQVVRERRLAERRAARLERQRLSRWVMPIRGSTLSAGFGEAGSMWSSGYHTGQDFAAPYGTPVHAASSGTITFAGWSGAYGNKVEITHPDGNQTWYAHMSEFAQTSGSVEPGDVIGYVGCTGNCFGYHLHFEFHPLGGAATDPMIWLDSQGAF